MYKYIVVLLGFVLVAQGVNIFTDNLTGFPNGWSLSGTAGQFWTKSSARYNSALYSVKCTPAAKYANNVDVFMEKTIDLSGYDIATLSFYVWQKTSPNTDYVQCQYYTNTWNTVWSRAGNYTSWQQVSVNIPVMATKIRFRFFSNSKQNAEGVYLDDITLDASQQSPTKEWTIMVYLNGDNNLETYGIQDFNEMEAGGGSDNNRNVIVQFDRAVGYDATNGDWTTCRRYYVNTDNTSLINSTLIQDIGEVDMGAPQTLVNFVNWTIQNYPANKYFLILWDHGDGWYKSGEQPVSTLFKSFSNDNSSGNAIETSNGELASALAQIKQNLGRNIDLIGWDACLMSMWEVMDITKNYADVLVGSEETEGADGWYYTTFLQNLSASPFMSAIDLGKAVVYSTTTQPTLSVVDLSLIPYLTARVDTFAQQLIAAKTSGYATEIQNARNSAKEFTISAHIDLYDFADKINSAGMSAILKTAATNVKNAVLNAVKLYKNSSYYAVCRGIAIYHPRSTSGYDIRYNNLPIAVYKWDEYIKGAAARPQNPIPPNSSLRMVSEQPIYLYPSVTRNRAMFTYRVMKSSNINLQIYNASGQLVKTVIDAHQEPGIYTTEAIVSNLGAGVYLYCFDNGTETSKGKIIISN